MSLAGKTVPRRMFILDIKSEPQIPDLWIRKKCGNESVLEAILQANSALVVNR
jgi:hypothetical protein